MVSLRDLKVVLAERGDPCELAGAYNQKTLKMDAFSRVS
jgi:hypothetical protein